MMRWCALWVQALALGSGAALAQALPASSAATALSFRMPAGSSTLAERFRLDRSGPCEVQLSGLRGGGAVSVGIDGRPHTAELLAEDDRGPATVALVRCDLRSGDHTVSLREDAGLQFYRVRGTRRYLATGSDYAGQPVFRLDVDDRHADDPVELRFGPGFAPFFRFSGKWGRYADQSYTQEVGDVTATSGRQSACLEFSYLHPPKNLVMPTRFTLERDPLTANVILHISQRLEATGPCSWGDQGNLEFLHVDLTPKHGRDWEDGVPDYFWNREQVDVDNDTLPGLRTHFVLYDDNSRRRFPYRASTRDPSLTAMSAENHTSFAHPLYAENTIGGWFSKAGVGSVGWVMHRYRSSFAEGISPIHSHCGDGADTHIYAGWGQLYLPWVLEKGDWLEAEYTLQCLPSEVLREEIEKINEFDLAFFGEEREAGSAIVRWYGTKDACGLVRSDGSALILGLGTADSTYPLSPETLRNVVSVFRLSELSHGDWMDDPARDGTALVRPGWVTVVDCGSALDGPRQRVSRRERLERQVLRLFGAEPEPRPGRP